MDQTALWPWYAILAYVFLRDGLPLFAKVVLPNRLKAADEEASHRRKMEDRQLAQQDAVVDAIRQMSINITVTNEKLAQLIVSNANTQALIMQHDRFANVAVTDIQNALYGLGVLSPKRRSTDVSDVPPSEK